MKIRIPRTTLILATSLFSLHAQADVKLSRVFSPHMVLQREMPVPIWGKADPGESVTVKFRGQIQTTKADDQGQWRVTLAPLTAGGPDVLEIGAITLADVLVGEVWLGSGQSNMDMAVKLYTSTVTRAYSPNKSGPPGDAPLAKLAAGTYPKLRLLRKAQNAQWEESNPNTNPEFSAQLFAFGQALQAQLDVPVGLMVGAVGGTPSGQWLTESMFQADTACQEMVKKMAPTYDYEGLKKAYETEKTKWDQDMTEWKRLSEEAKKAGTEAPRAPRPPQAVGRPGQIHSGKMGGLFESFIRPYVGYAIRGVLWDQGESKTNVACVDQYTLMGALIKGWRKEWGQNFPFLYVQKPSGGGTAWDLNDPLTAEARRFAPQPPTPPGPEAPDYSHELHLRLMDYPGTHMVTSSDLGEGIHPVLKSSYGQRAAHVAMAVAYGAKHEIYGPLYQSHKVEGGRIRIEFKHTGKGLAARHSEKLQGFAIAGADRKFKWADAVIDGQSIVVSSAAVPNPESVRYAWSSAFPWANLFNQDGLPAQPFRTDRW